MPEKRKEKEKTNGCGQVINLCNTNHVKSFEAGQISLDLKGLSSYHVTVIPKVGKYSTYQDLNAHPLTNIERHL